MLPGLTGAIVGVGGGLDKPTLIQRGSLTINTGGATTYTFTDYSIGAGQSSTRRVIAAVFWESSADRTLSSATIGGESAAIDIQAAYDSVSRVGVAIVSATVPSGTTATIVATLSGSVDGCAVMAITLDGLASVTPTDTAFKESSPTEGVLDWLADGYVIAAVVNSGTATYTWSGLTEREDSNFDTSRASLADDFKTTTETAQTVTATDSGGALGRAFVVASYR